MDLDITFNELIEIDFTEKSSEFSRVLGLLVDAERDWRVPSTTANEFLERVEVYINDVITKTTISKAIKHFGSDILNAAWELESLEILLEILELYPDKNIRYVLKELMLNEN